MEEKIQVVAQYPNRVCSTHPFWGKEVRICLNYFYLKNNQEGDGRKKISQLIMLGNSSF